MLFSSTYLKTGRKSVPPWRRDVWTNFVPTKPNKYALIAYLERNYLEFQGAEASYQMLTIVLDRIAKIIENSLTVITIRKRFAGRKVKPLQEDELYVALRDFALDPELRLLLRLSS